MYCVKVLYPDSFGFRRESVKLFDNIDSCKSFIDEFPKVFKWSIHPLLVQDPCMSDDLVGLYLRLNVVVSFRDGSRSINNDLMPDTLISFLNSVDPYVVSEVKIRYRL